MRILHIVENLNVGGLEQVVIQLIKEQQRRGYKCAVVCLFEKGVLAPEIESLDIPVKACNKRVGLDFHAINTIIENVNDFNPDVIHSHNLVCHYYAAFVKLKLFSRARIINTRHGIGRGGKNIKEKVLYGLAMLLSNRAVGVCAATTEKLKLEYPLYKKKFVTIANGIVLDAFKPCSDKTEKHYLYDLRWPNNSIYLGIVARLSVVKNHRLLLNAFVSIHNVNPSTRLLIIGDGELRTELEAYTEQLGLMDSVVFMGERRDIPEILAALDLFVLTSTEEGHSISLLEACASGLPIVATDVGGNADIVSADHGVLIPSGNEQMFASAVINLLEDREKLRLMGENARKWVEQNASIESMASSYEKIYAQG